MTRRQLAQMLVDAHKTAPWREIARNMGGRVPAGTLSRIAKTNGQYIPRKWLAYFGISRQSASKPQRATRLADLPAREIKRMFENRVEM